MVTLVTGGSATYAGGKIVLRYFPSPPGVPPFPLWTTPSDQAATYLPNLDSVLQAHPISQSVALQEHIGVQIQVKPGPTPTVTIKYLSTGAQHQFAATCSDGGVMHGTAPVKTLIHGATPVTTDFLIFIRRGIVPPPIQ